MACRIEYHGEAVQADILALPAALLARYAALSRRMLLFGSNLGEPHSKALGGGLFELRLKAAQGIARVLYCTLPEQQIVMLHCFIKKSQKTPVPDLQLALLRMKEVKDAYARRTDTQGTAKPVRAGGS